MAVDTTEIELHTEALAKFGKEHPQTLQWLLHNFDAIKNVLDDLDDQDTTNVTNIINQINEISLTPGPQGDPGPPGEASTVPGPQGDPGPPGPPGVFIPPEPFGDGWVLTHGSGGAFDYFWQAPEDASVIFAALQTGDLIPVNEGTDDEALLPEFVLDPDGKVMMVPLS